MPGKEFEAAILSTSYGNIIQDKVGNKSEGLIQSYFLLNGEKSTLWVKRNENENFIRAKRIIAKEATKINDDNASILRQSCTTYSFTDYGVYCTGGYDTYCEIYSYTDSYTECTGSEEKFRVNEWGGGGGGGYSPPPPPPPNNQPDPCATAQAQAITTFSANTKFQNAISQIQGAVHDGAEHGISFGKDNNGNIIKSAMSTGDENSGTAPSISNKFADIHNHRDNSPPSPGDIYAFIDGIINQPNFTTRYVISSGGDVYALVLTDKQAAINFNNNNPRVIRTYKDNQGNIREYPPSFPNEIFDKLDDVKTSLFNNGVHSDLLRDESSLSYMLQQYNVGISLLKMNNLGEFKKIKTKETNNNGNPIFTPDNCL